MDNIEPQETPAGSDDVTSSPDNASYDTQTAEPTNSVDDGNEGNAGSSNPWDNDPKFKGKAPEDIYKAYKEAEKLTGQLSQKAEVANLLEARGFTPQQIKAQIEQMDYQQQQQRYAENPLAPVLDKVSALEARIQAQDQEKARASLEREVDAFVKENPGYETSREKILKLATTPGIGFDPRTAEDIATVAEIAREYFGEARAQGQQDAYKKIDTKLMTQATGTKSAPSQKITEADLDNMSTKEIDKLMGW